jgi:hypothetical protein
MGGDPAADGSNKVAVLDPTSNSVTLDRQSGIPVMNEVLTVLGVTKTGDPSHPDAVNEWCINSAAIDINRKCAIINSEDGRMYRWSFVTNTLTEGLRLPDPTAEAYTETAIGPDGQLYVINNTILFAIGSTKATTVSAVTGTAPKGNVLSIWNRDSDSFSVKSVSSQGGQAAAIEADFNVSAVAPTSLNIAVDVTSTSSSLGTLWVYNFSSQAFEQVASGNLSTTDGFFQTSIANTVPNYIGPKGQVRLRVQGVVTGSTAAQFTLMANQITCNAN